MLLRLFGEDPVTSDPDATFLDLRRDLEPENWGNYERLLETYVELKRALAAAEPTGARPA